MQKPSLLFEVPIGTVGKLFETFVYQKLLYILLGKKLDWKLHRTLMNHPILSIKDAL